MSVSTSTGQAPRQATPRSLEVLVQHVRTEVPCGHCSAEPGKPCRARGGSVHLARFVRALILRQVTGPEIAVVLRGLDVFTAATVIRAAR